MDSSDYNYTKSLQYTYILDNIREYFGSIYYYGTYSYDTELINYLIHNDVIPAIRDDIEDNRYHFKYAKSGELLSYEYVENLKYIDICMKLNIIPEKICHIVCCANRRIYKDYKKYLFNGAGYSNFEDVKFYSEDLKKEFIQLFRQEYSDINDMIIDVIRNTKILGAG